MAGPMIAGPNFEAQREAAFDAKTAELEAAAREARLLDEQERRAAGVMLEADNTPEMEKQYQYDRARAEAQAAWNQTSTAQELAKTKAIRRQGVDATPTAPAEGVEAAMIAEGLENVVVDEQGNALDPVTGKPPVVPDMDPVLQVAKPGAVARGTSVSGGGGMSPVARVAQGPKAPTQSGVLTAMQARAQNTVNLEKELAGIREQERLNDRNQLAYMARSGEAYEAERDNARNMMRRVSHEVDATNRRFNDMMDQGIDPYTNQRIGVGGMQAAILAAASAFMGEDPQKTFDFFDDLIDKDVQQQKGLLELTEGKLNNQLAELQRVTGDYDAAEQLYRANQLEQYAKQADMMAGQVQSAQEGAKLRDQALGLLQKSEELKYQGEAAAFNAMLKQQQALARARAAGRGRATGKARGDYGKIGAEKLAQHRQAMKDQGRLVALLKKLKDSGKYGAAERVLWDNAGGVMEWVNQKAANTLGTEEGKLYRDIIAANKMAMKSKAKNVYGSGMTEKEEKSFTELQPTLAYGLDDFLSAAEQEARDLETTFDIYTHHDEEYRESSIEGDPYRDAKNFGIDTGVK